VSPQNPNQQNLNQLNPNETNLIDRYQARRTRQFLASEEIFRQWLPKWRTRRRRRLLVIALGVVFAAMTVSAVAFLFNTTVAPLLWIPLTFVFVPLWTSVQVVSGRQGDAPRDALDEWEIQQRNSARSIALTVTQTLVFIVAIFLIFTTTVGWNVERLAYSGGGMAITAMLIGACTPAMILAWTQPDPEPGDMD
jgi:hypothetical protein